MGRVYIVDDIGKMDELLDEFCTFPLSQHDDIVDSCTLAFNELQKTAPISPPKPVGNRNSFASGGKKVNSCWKERY